MSRIRQLHPSDYRTPSNISDEFEQLTRYLNAAELGDYTIGELLSKLFDTDGVFDGPIEFSLTSSDGFRYRIGEYTSTTEGWNTLMTWSELRGQDGVSVGTIEGEVFHNRQTSTATAAQTVFNYSWESTEDVLVFKNGILQIEGAAEDYQSDQAAGTITFNSAMAGGEEITTITVRAGSVTNYRRSDQTAAAGQAVFPFTHTSLETLLVYKNGVLQQEGGANDYTASASSDTVTFTSTCTAGDKITILTVENLAIQNVTGLMLESAWTDGAGAIPYAKLSIADGDIPQAKVSGLTSLLTNRGRMYVSATTPTGMTAGDLWIDTSTSPNTPKFYDGTNWLDIASSSGIPTYSSANANQQLFVNATGTAMEWGDYDDSHLVPKTYMAAANGVATLDGTGVIPTTQVPDIFALSTLYQTVSGSVTNGTYTIQFVFLQKIRIDGICHRLSAGSCTVQISVDGSPVGDTHSVSTTKTSTTLGTSIEIDGTSTARSLEITVTGASTASDLEVGLAVASISA